MDRDLVLIFSISHNLSLLYNTKGVEKREAEDHLTTLISDPENRQ